MNWFFNLVFLGITWSAVFVDDTKSSESIFLPKMEVIESVFKRSFENASYVKSFDGERTHLKGGEEKPQDILSYRQHGFHPANAETWKLQCVWNAMHTVARHLPDIVSSKNDSGVMVKCRTLCSSHAWENCGLDMNETTCDPKLEYRSIDGTCNNLKNTKWGSAPQPFERFVPSDYGNGVSSFRLSEKGKELPNPRKISRALSKSKQGVQPEVTLMLMSWGQFIDHDITLTPEREADKKLIECATGEIISGQCLTFSSEKLSWNDAKMKCASQNGRLAVLNDPRAFMTHVSTNYKDTDFWIGASDIANEGSWVWLDGRPLGDQFPWHYGEPNAAFENEDCLRTSSDAPCHYLERFVCEKDQFGGSSTMECCDGGSYGNSIRLWDDCVPINVTGDSFYVKNNRQCIRFVRSMAALKGCEFSAMEQINRNTAFIDGSMVYGSDIEVGKFLRTGEKGLLNTTMNVGNGQPLPPRGGDSIVHQCPQSESMDRCFLAGDVRVDEVPGLTAMHTIFIRLHNIIAEELCNINPGWCNNDEKIFQETRRLVIALIQQITYRDWLPHVIGQSLIEENLLDVGSQGYRDTYDPNVNPTIRNVFATAAFRFGHTLVADVIKAAKHEHNLELRGNFFNIHVIQNISTSPSSLIKGLTRCPSAPVDVIVESPLTESLFAHEPADDGNFYGLDLVSINIQRGRDHGIPGYRNWRKFCGLDDITKFYKLKKVMSHDVAEVFRNIYSKVGDIDLFPAGLAESPTDDGILGPTFSCIIARQFANMKHGDRFWYEREDQPKPFRPDQLSSIRSQALVSILCRVLEHTSFGFQPNPFFVETKMNAAIDCSSYNFINLHPWREPQKDPECTTPWFSIGNQCFFVDGTGYNNRNWASARAYCGTLVPGGDLAQPKDIQALADYLFPIHHTYYWLGGSDLATEGEWLWLNGSTVTGWRQNEPNNEGDEDCLTLHPVYGANSLFDRGCEQTQYMKFVCEKNMVEKYYYS